jgi:hypothetical protein
VVGFFVERGVSSEVVCAQRERLCLCTAAAAAALTAGVSGARSVDRPGVQHGLAAGVMGIA